MKLGLVILGSHLPFMVATHGEIEVIKQRNTFIGVIN